MQIVERPSVGNRSIVFPMVKSGEERLRFDIGNDITADIIFVKRLTILLTVNCYQSKCLMVMPFLHIPA